MSRGIYEYVEKVKGGYQVIKDYDYFSMRYQKHIRIKTTDGLYDGATYAKDINSFSWLIHDVLKRDGVFDDNSKCTNWQSSMILMDILISEGRYIRAIYWPIGTFIYGLF